MPYFLISPLPRARARASTRTDSPFRPRSLAEPSGSSLETVASFSNRPQPWSAARPRPGRRIACSSATPLRASKSSVLAGPAVPSQHLPAQLASLFLYSETRAARCVMSSQQPALQQVQQRRCVHRCYQPAQTGRRQRQTEGTNAAPHAACE